MVCYELASSVSESLEMTTECRDATWINSVRYSDILQSETSQIKIRVIEDSKSEPILPTNNLASFDLNGTSRKSHLQE